MLAEAAEPLGGTIALDGLSGPLLAVPAVRRLVIALVERDAGELRWLLSTRAAGALPIASWMAYGLLDAPLGAADLRFTRGEAAAVAQARRCRSTRRGSTNSTG